MVFCPYHENVVPKTVAFHFEFGSEITKNAKYGKTIHLSGIVFIANFTIFLHDPHLQRFPDKYS